MARVSSLTVATVSAAVEAIKARGERVSLRTVRGELGEGSLTTIQRLLGEIGEDRPAPVSQVKKAESATLPDRIAQAINAEIEAAKESMRAGLQEVIERLTADLEATMKEVERLNNLVEEKEEKLGQMREDMAILETSRQNADEQKRQYKDLLELTQKERDQEREKRHAAELDAAMQTGLAQDIKKQADEAAKESSKTITEAKALISELSGELKTEREARHAAELDAAKQAGLAQRMQDVAIELKKKIEEGSEKTGNARKPATAKTESGQK